MDFKRIEAILLVVFLGINIFLGFEILHTPIQLSDPAQKSWTSLYREMATDNIVLPKKLSDQPQDGYYLAAKQKDQLNQVNVHGTRSYSTSDKILTVTLTKPVKLSKHAAKALQQVKKFVRDPANVAYGKHYLYDSVASNENTYVFVQNSDYGPLYFNGAKLEITVSRNSIISYRQSYLSSVTAVREKQATIGARHAVKSLYTLSELPNNTKVKAVKLGYGHLTNVRGNIIFLPVWRIDLVSRATGGTSVKQINAFTGALLPTSN
ncbi:MAG: two-component system regulatory protein YycI [Lactobacillus sp.]|jgi:regulatory protein YycI of two-component signal transduction system YycFG|nr:two-component system regulatory protein YycI [Lactobacillus sp.]MCH3905711.1 two-component system regulatory protein YycI [Lactobacillus sp.]MCH3990720.1 two-component system regulatory protein YycI [Lactobacillus sp.]MCH4068564.1 two-component system regulatory protein YycI [Lactobacillus sp.]MCI1304141.1 two-component system regulatory protein YycI [Lactobacillus sp.]